MICRLCLSVSDYMEGVELFDSNECETQTLQLVDKYFNLKLTANDYISTNICGDCYSKLIDFHQFWLMVADKQIELQENQQNGKCSDTKAATEDFNSKSQHEPLLDIRELEWNSTEPIDPMLFGESKESELKNDEGGDIFTIKFENSDHDLETADEYLENKSDVDSVDSTGKDPDWIGKILSKRKTNDETINEFMELICEKCNEKAANFNKLCEHFQNVHKSAAYIICCNKQYKQKCELVEHIKWHENPDIYRCTLCKKNLLSKRKLKRHKKEVHNIDKEVKCNVCNKSFILKDDLKKHLSYTHKIRHACEYCDKNFTTPHTLSRHIKSIHENVYLHVCDTCGKKFKFKPSFERHILEHQGIIDPPAQCKVCGEWLKNKESLRLHASKHDKVNVKCHICGHISPSNVALRGHIRYMHETDKKFSCTYCDKKFKEKYGLTEHLAVHSGIQLYSCEHCPKEFRCKSNMYAHVKKKHTDEWLQSKIARSNDPTLKAETKEMSDKQLQT